jgi:uncharacterized protein YyaL (SSP411 family)
MPSYPQTIIDSVNEFFNEHREQLAQRRRGLFEQLREEYQATSQRQISMYMFKTLATKYRREHDVKFEALSPYYKPRVRAASA